MKQVPFGGKIVDTAFFYLDQFILLAAKNAMYLYKYKLQQGLRNDIQRSQNKSKYQLVDKWSQETQSITSFTAVNSFLSHLIVSAGSNRSIMMIDASTGQTVRTIPSAHSRPVHSISFPTSSSYVSHPQGCYDLFVTSATDSSVNLWDVRENARLMRFGEHLNRVHKIDTAFSPCMRYVATGSEDKVACMYDLRTGRLLEKLHGHTDVVCSLAFNPLHPQLATSSFDGKVCFFTDGSRVQVH